jgi:hypothetical protein
MCFARSQDKNRQMRKYAQAKHLTVRQILEKLSINRLPEFPARITHYSNSATSRCDINQFGIKPR